MPGPKQNSASPKPPRSVAKSIADSVDAPAALVPILPELFADLESLGTIPDLVIELLQRAGCDKNWRILDLACGKGAAAVAIADHFKCRITGVDAFKPFIDAARALARERKVTQLCTWKVQDVDALRPRAEYECAMMLGLYGFAEAAPLLRSHTKAGGVYIIDDAVLARRDKRLGWPARADALELFESLGDELLEELVIPERRLRDMHEEIETALMLRASVLAQERPTLARGLEDFIDRQREAGKLLERRLRPVHWVVRKSAESAPSSAARLKKSRATTRRKRAS